MSSQKQWSFLHIPRKFHLLLLFPSFKFISQCLSLKTSYLLALKCKYKFISWHQLQIKILMNRFLFFNEIRYPTVFYNILEIFHPFILGQFVSIGSLSLLRGILESPFISPFISFLFSERHFLVFVELVFGKTHCWIIFPVPQIQQLDFLGYFKFCFHILNQKYLFPLFRGQKLNDSV